MTILVKGYILIAAIRMIIQRQGRIRSSLPFKDQQKIKLVANCF